MMKRPEFILLFMLIFCGAVLFGDMPAGAQSPASITGVSIDGGKIVTSLSGQTPIDPCYNENPSDPASPCLPMEPVSELWICDGAPVFPDLSNCRKFSYSTLGFAYNCTVNIGGTYVWLYKGTCR